MRRAGVLGLLLALAGCSGPTPRDPNIIVVAMANSPTNFDPAVGLDEASQKIHQLLFSSLVRIDESLRVVPDLAVRFDWPDPLTYVAELPTGVRFHDGTELTAAGEKAAASFERSDNPRFRCETTSIIFDWTFDGPVNRITQNKDTIVLQYGQFGLRRTIDMNMKQHPANIKPSRSGHSTGYWEGDVLVVDTAGFLPGVLNAPVLHSDKLHVVERFSLDPKTFALTRSYAADDQVFLKGKYTGSDVIQVADAPYSPERCQDLGSVDYSKQGEQKR